MHRRSFLALACGVGGLALPVALRPARALAGGAPRAIRLDALRHRHAPTGFEGETCAAMALEFLGHPHSADDVFAASGLNASLGRGCTPAELDTALTALGLDTGVAWRPIADGDRERVVARVAWREVAAELRAGRPVILYLGAGAGETAGAPGYALIAGLEGGEVLLHDPARADGAWTRRSLQTLLERWPADGGDGTRGLVTLRARPIGVEPPERAAGVSELAYAQHVQAVRSKIRARLSGRFLVVVEPPFVAITDGGVELAQRYVSGTIRWAVHHLRKDYFRRDPTKIIDIWLFRDHESYLGNTRRLFNEEPDTPYGYYDPAHAVLIMNIATGGGTLVHELVHPFMAANFERCPSWFNEGLASLYEQSAEVDGRLTGLTNWRLEGLQWAIRRNRVPSFEQLCATGWRPFYDEDPGTNYAQARYLCYYLQERGLLRRYFHAFRTNHRSDPTGYATLRGVLGNPDMVKFQERWERFVLDLEYP